MNKIYIYDNIGFEGITAKGVADELTEFDGAEVDVHINSGGGSVSQGIAIYNLFKAYAGNVTVHIDGLAASIASVIAMSGDQIVMAEGSLMMIHSAWTAIAGNAVDLRKEADVLDAHDRTIRAIYNARTNLGDDFITDLMEAETWMDGAEALNFRMADSLGGELKAAASVDFSKYNKVASKYHDLLIDLSNVTDSKEEAANEAPQDQINDDAACLVDMKNRLAGMEKLGELSL